MIALARKTLVYEWRRFLPVVLAIGFSGVLLTVQAALVLGIFGNASLYVSQSSGDLWVGYPGTQSVNFGRAVSPDIPMRLRLDPEARRVEAYEWVDGDWTSERTGASVSIYLSGIATHPDALMFSRLLPAPLRQALREPGAVVVDPADMATLGVDAGARAWINGQAVRVVGQLPGLRGLGGVNVLSSLDTARAVANRTATGATYYVAKLREGANAEQVRARLAHLPASLGPSEVWTAQEFAWRSQQYWLLDTGAGVAVVFMTAIVCLVGAIITGQSLKSAIAGSSREYATLNALGVGRGAMVRVVLEQAAMLGGVGAGLAAVVSAALLVTARMQQVPVAMNLPVAIACALVVAALVLLSSVSAVRQQLRIEPALLLR
ncbi:FtsX-like permease family protein [Roseateles sp. MS654]|uniref:FtsX-like permease family protein n=1 Tax=Roseateles sp. MS654 TaxID=3412685 RepID=UPI003C2F85EF